MCEQCFRKRTSGVQSRAVVVYREVTLASRDPSIADYQNACVSAERRKEADRSICLHFWLYVCSGQFVLLITEPNHRLSSLVDKNNPAAKHFFLLAKIKMNACMEKHSWLL